MTDDFELPDLTIPDLSWRVRVLEARMEALQCLCLALAATRPQQEMLETAWGAVSGKLVVESFELEAMTRDGATLGPEETSFLRSEIHQTERAWKGLRRHLQG